MIIAAFLGNISEYQIVQDALWGVRIAASALILSSIIKLFKSGVKDVFGMVMFLLALFLTGAFGVSSVVMVILPLVGGNLYRYFKDRKGEKA